MGNRLNHKPKRPRKLLLHKSEIEKFAGKASQRGFTLVPLRLYFKDGRAKVEIAVARGKQMHDKREAHKKADAEREIARAMAHRRRG
jgi:SsrA-binding protein